MVVSPAALSGNDSAVLGALFDPEASLSSQVQLRSSAPVGYTESELKVIQVEERQALNALNCDNPSKVDIKSTIAALSVLIERTPRYASAWNNRGQARRMLFNLGPLEAQHDLLRQIVEDLDQAIALAGPKSPAEPVPVINANVLASAHTHRGLLFWSTSRSQELREALTRVVPRLAAFDADQLEEAASHEFAFGGRYGNETAKQLAVKLNPYAKLCGSIVKEAMQKEISEYYQGPITKVN